MGAGVGIDVPTPPARRASEAEADQARQGRVWDTRVGRRTGMSCRTTPASAEKRRKGSRRREKMVLVTFAETKVTRARGGTRKCIARAIHQNKASAQPARQLTPNVQYRIGRYLTPSGSVCDSTKQNRSTGQMIGSIGMAVDGPRRTLRASVTCA